MTTSYVNEDDDIVQIKTQGVTTPSLLLLTHSSAHWHNTESFNDHLARGHRLHGGAVIYTISQTVQSVQDSFYHRRNVCLRVCES